MKAPNDRLELPFFDLEVNLIDRLQAPKIFAKVFRLKIHGVTLLFRFRQ
jgi:hypothetical protein